MPVPVPFGPPVDECALCGRPVASDEDVGIFGLNGVIGITCTQNLTYYTPRRGTIVTSDGSLQVWSYFGGPGSQFHGEPVGCLCLDAADVTRDRHRLEEYYDSLDYEHQKLIWHLGVGTPPDDYERVLTFDEAADRVEMRPQKLAQAFGGLFGHPDREAPEKAAGYRPLYQQLPRPFMLTDRLYAPVDDEDLLADLRSFDPRGEGASAEQVGLDAIDEVETTSTDREGEDNDRSDSTPDDTGGESAGSDTPSSASESASREQAGLGQF